MSILCTIFFVNSLNNRKFESHVQSIIQLLNVQFFTVYITAAVRTIGCGTVFINWTNFENNCLTIVVLLPLLFSSVLVPYTQWNPPYCRDLRLKQKKYNSFHLYIRCQVI